MKIYHITEQIRQSLGMQGRVLGACRHGARVKGHILSVLTKVGTGYYLYRMGDNSREFVHSGETARVAQLKDQHSTNP